MTSNNKMKGLLKGLRYISEIFENEKEPEMKIGMPTDVKHVAHIGWEGPSAVNTAPSWMNEFKSAPLANNGEVREEDPAKWASQDGISREGVSSATDMQEVPKSSKRSSFSSTKNGKEESKVKDKTDKSKQSKKSSKTSSSSKETSDSSTKHKKKSKDPNQVTDSKSEDPKKTTSRRKKSKESADGSSRRSKTRDLDNGSESGSVRGARDRDRDERLSKTSGFEEWES